MVTREAEWDDDERAWVLALLLFRESLCPVCGGPSEECQAPETLDEARMGRFVVESLVCTRTAEMRREMATVSESAKAAGLDPSAFVFTTRRREAAGG